MVPVYNEAGDLERSVRRLHAYLSQGIPFSWRITIADNASTDGTAEIAVRLAGELSGIRVVALPEKGRGRALRAAWSTSDAAVLAYMDVDLSTDLNGLLPLVAPLISGHSDVSIGSRLARGSAVTRGVKREVISRAYNVLLHATLHAKFSDAQCGFKAIRADVARDLLPLIRDDAWFFDTELLVLAERAGLRIHEVPVDWSDDPDSRVDIARTAFEDLRGIVRLARSFARGALPLDTIGLRRQARQSPEAPPGLKRQLVRFGLIGLISTGFYGLLYLAARSWFEPQLANASALLIATFANTAANRRITFGIRGSGGAVRHQMQGLAILAVALAVTSGSLAALQALVPSAGTRIELAVLTAANIVATLVRFLLFRGWVFARRRPPESATPTADRLLEPQPSVPDAAWVRPAFITLLAGTALLYLWGLSASGWANSFYSAAAQAGSQGWEAFFFGASDAANSITVDKPPLFLWPMDLSVRLFGLNAWSILVPQALMGVASVGVLYATVRRWFSPAAALLSGAVLALTPVAVLMFRFNNPDAALTLLLAASAYATVRAIEQGRTRWIVLVGALVGCAFLTKMLAAFLVVPAFALAYLVAAPPRLRRRIGQLLLGGAAMVAAGGWWVAIVQLVPGSARPYIGGSQHNSALELIFGYNGFGRLTGNEVGSLVGHARVQSGSGRWGPTSWLRLFQPNWGGQVAWLLPAAVLFLLVGVWMTRRTPRLDRTRAALLLWGGWLLVSAAAFSFGQGIIHPYYTVALAPAIGALVGVGTVMLWQRRSRIVARLALAVAIAGTSVLAVYLLDRSPGWHPDLRPLILVAGIGGAGLLLMGERFGSAGRIVAVAAGLIATLSAPLGYSLETAATPQTGAIPLAGPIATAEARPKVHAGPGAQASPVGRGSRPVPPVARRSASRGHAHRGGSGGLLAVSTPSPTMVALLDKGASAYTWVAAAVGSNRAAGYQLATDRSVMPVGGFNGSDPFPTLAEFRRLVRHREIHWFIGSGRGFVGAEQLGGSRAAARIERWVERSFRAEIVGGLTVYDLSNRTSAVGRRGTMVQIPAGAVRLRAARRA